MEAIEITPTMVNVNVNKEQPLRKELQNFVRAVRMDIKPYVTAEEALNVLEIALKVKNNTG